MIFKLSEEHQMIQKMVRDFAHHEVEPTAKERDEEERFDMELFAKMAELGLTGIPWPEEYGESAATISPTSSRLKSFRKSAPQRVSPCLPIHRLRAGRFMHLEQKNRNRNI